MTMDIDHLHTCGCGTVVPCFDSECVWEGVECECYGCRVF